MDKSQVLRKLKENGTSFESFNNGYIMQVGKQIKVYEDGYKGPKVITQAQQNKLLAIRPTLVKDTRLMYVDDDNNSSDEKNDDADDEESTINKRKTVKDEKKKSQCLK
ncbi:MAG: hypothetical protein EZS28_026304 [Streblomastix strix]|uniref:Uncharacterized protein n=1 Tax=Streblomastix strix TaxID=222440 RepID=A0A5J4V736_9EUKA|nr:MAG: hypothetical protein EZS28_026304 [Streblomastix strix]